MAAFRNAEVGAGQAEGGGMPAAGQSTAGLTANPGHHFLPSGPSVNHGPFGNPLAGVCVLCTHGPGGPYGGGGGAQ